MQKAEIALAAEVAGWLKAADTADRKDDASLGTDQRGDEMPDWVADKQKRLAKIKEAKAALEAEAKAQADAKAKDNDDGSGNGPRPGRKPKHPPGEPKPKAQRNFTDPDSRIMPGRDGFIQAYNGQAAVDATAQIIVAHSLSNSPQMRLAWFRLQTRSRGIWGSHPRRFRRTLAIVRKQTSPPSKNVRFPLTSQPVRQSGRRLEARWAARSPRRCVAS
jgi:hypothetical protein